MSQPSLSSFFKPKPARVEPEVLTIDDSDDDEQYDEPVQQPKQAPKPQALAKGKGRLADFQLGATSRAASAPLSDKEERKRDYFRDKLTAVNLLNRKSAYLQTEHYMSAGSKVSSRDGQTPLQPDEDGDEENSADEHDSDDEPPRKRKKTSKHAIESKTGASKYAVPGQTKKGKAAETEPSSSYTPLEKQIIKLREAHEDKLLMFEVGYKYRFYEDDARIASRLLGIACFKQRNFWTASVPTHRLNVHVKKLISAGHKVGVIRQLETAALKKAGSNRSAPFDRGLTDVYTYATLVDDLSHEPLSDETPTLLTVAEQPVGSDGEKVRIGLVAVRASTGEIIHDEFEDTLMRAELETRILHLQPAELLLQEGVSRASEGMLRYLVDQGTAWDRACRIERFRKKGKPGDSHAWLVDFLTKASKDITASANEHEIVIDDDEDEQPAILVGHFTKVLSLPPLVMTALEATVKHLSPFNLTTMFLESDNYTTFSQQVRMSLSGNTLANLEVLRNSTDFTTRGSLLSVVDHCQTAFGRRLLRKWLTRPLLSLERVKERSDAVQELNTSKSLALSKMLGLLKSMPDLERGLIRIHIGKATPLELTNVLWALKRVGDVFDGKTGLAGDITSPLLKRLAESLPAVREQTAKILAQIDAGPARAGKKADMFVDPTMTEELEEAKENIAIVQTELKGALNECRQVLGRPSLQYKTVAEEEFLIEVSRVGGDKKVPIDWIRINATKSALRYRPPAVQKLVEELERYKETLDAVAQETYLGFLNSVSKRYELFRATISDLATLDCLSSLARVASLPGYTRPTFVEGDGKLDIRQGRHPMVEVVLPDPFVPNDIQLGDASTKQMVLTGLNMGGKSSLSRSVALIVLLAQIGSYVPAASCTLSVFDSIFTRMGATDEIARGRSTFMVEMTETSEILKLATRRSLIILDELGRGTSTLDGQAIAHAVLEYVTTQIQACCIFVTHYPSLSALEKAHPDSVSCWHMACIEKERPDGFADVTFLFKLKRGLASKSHGLNVARMAQLPDSVLKTALHKSRELAGSLEERRKERRAGKMGRLLSALASGSLSAAEAARELVEITDP